MSENNHIKPFNTKNALTNVASTSKDTERLSSFKLPRDLTLGGLANKQKKVFTPNLNVVRNKNKAEITPNLSKSHSRNQRHDDHRSRNHKGGGPIRGGNLIQSQGVFSEGIVGNKSIYASRGGTGGGGSSIGSGNNRGSLVLEKPKLNLSTDNKVNEKDEQLKLSEIYGKNNSIWPIADNPPVELPLKPNDVNIKQELTEDKFPKIKTETMPSLDKIEDLFVANENKLLFFQLPESLPGYSKSSDDNAASSSQSSLNSSQENKCTFKDVDEGYIGKLVMFKSGKVKFKLGNTFYDLHLGTQKSFLQDLVSIDSETSGGSMINLGHIENDLVVTPDWNYLMNDQNS